MVRCGSEITRLRPICRESTRFRSAAPFWLFTAAVSLLASALFGIDSRAQVRRAASRDGPASGGRSVSESRERHRARNVLVVIQVALALVLLISSGLMIRTFQALRNVDPGFSRPQEVQTLRISIPQSAVRSRRPSFEWSRTFVDRLAEIPGVPSVGFTTICQWTAAAGTIRSSPRITSTPRNKFLRFDVQVRVARADRDDGQPVDCRPRTDMDRHLREAAGRDDLREPRARAMEGAQAAIGKRIRDNSKAPWREVVGVVSDERTDGVNEKSPTTVYVAGLDGQVLRR